MQHLLQRVTLLLVLVLAATLPSSAAPVLAAQRLPASMASQGRLESDAEQGGAQPTYTIVDLGAFYPHAVNNRQQVAGELPGESAALWQQGTLYDLGKLGGNRARFIDINENNQLTGSARVNSNDSSFRWTDGNQNQQIDAGEVQWLGSLGGHTVAEAINNSGHVVGNSQDADGYPRAFLWTGASIQDLGDAGSKNSHAYDINDTGTIVGQSCAYGACAVRWVNGAISTIAQGGDPTEEEGDEGSARGTSVNNLGHVAGYSDSCGCLSSTRTSFALLPGLTNIHASPGSGTNPLINNENQILVLGAGSLENGLLVDGQVRKEVKDLLPPNSGWSRVKATAFNDRGDIVGIGQYKGASRAFLLSPLRWTLLYYLAADNNLNGSYPPIFQHLESKANLPGVRILVLWDTGGNNGSWYYEVQHDTDPSKFATYTEDVNLWPQGELNMGAPFTLSDFIKWGVQRSPSEHYALILDDHGSGLGGLAWDDTSNSDFINLPELKLALDTAFDSSGEKMDVLYMAMCLMGMVEDGWQVRERADFYVASEDLQTTYTSYLTGFEPLMEPAQVAAAFADAYSQEMIARNKAFTISAADLSKLGPLVSATNGLGQALAARMGVVAPTLSTVAGLVQRFDNQSPRGITLADTAVDLYDFADLVGSNLGGEAAIVAQAAAVKQALDDYVIYEAHASSAVKKLDNSHGVSIFFPANSSSFYNPANYTFAVGADWGAATAAAAAPLQATTWAGFLASYVQATAPNVPDTPTAPLPQPKEVDESLLFLPLVAR